MKDVFSILFGAAFTVAVSLALGSLLLRALRLRFFRLEAALFAFIAGSGLLSLLVTLLALAQLARKGVFLWTGLALIAVSLWRARSHPLPRRSLPAVRLDWLVPLNLVFTAFFIYYFINALAPEVSPDGSGYHLGNVARMWRHHGFDWAFRSMYSYLSQGIEMLFLFAFSFGKHSAAAMVHLAFACALPLLMLCYGRRFGLFKPAAFAALLVFVSPVVAKDAISAYNDMAVVTVIYAVFYLLQVWDQKNESNLLLLIGLLSGFAYAVKYTALLTLPVALIWVWWRRQLRWITFLMLTLPAALLIAPWVVRNWIWVGNPLAPFANAWFPNPFYHTGMERIYVETLKHYTGLKHWWQIPLELTLRGQFVGGVFSPAFLLLPLSLLALFGAVGQPGSPAWRAPARTHGLGLSSLRVSHARRLLFAALVFAAPAWFNIGARFLIPSAPFAAMALGIALEAIPAALPVVLLFTVLVSWPPLVSTYCDPWTWRIGGFPKAEAFRQVPLEPYILNNLPDYGLKAPIERNVPPGDLIFSFAGRPDAYIDRDIVVSYESTLGNLVNDILWAPQAHPPAIREHFHFLPVETRVVRVVNNTANDNFWTVAEMRVFSQGSEVPRAADWRVSAYPNGWEAPLAFDNSYATRWSTWQPMRAHDRISLEFPRPLRIDQVTLECDPAWEAKLQVDILLPSGRWVPLTDTVTMEKAEPPGGIRLAATRDVKLLGIRYLLVNEGDLVYQDLKKNLPYWGLTQLANVNGTHFYRID